MRINSNNYETFFLMYVDEELSPAEKQEVDAFVMLHPGLAAELEMLLQTKLDAEPFLSFGDKTALYKSGALHIDENNYEEYFLLYVDNELNDDEKVMVEKFAASDTHYKAALAILSQTVLPEEPLIFADKQSLYKTEKPERRVITFKPLQWAVAAALVGIAVATWFLLPSGKNNMVAVNKPVTLKPATIIKQPVTQQPADKNLVASAGKPTIKTGQLVVIKAHAVKTNGAGNKTAYNTTQHLPDATIAVTRKTINAHEIAAVNKPVLPGETSTVKSMTIKDEILKPLLEADINKTHAAEAIYAANEKNISLQTQPAVYRELDTDEDDTNKAVYVGNMQLDKNKVKGFLKKATRFFSNKAKENISPNDDGKLQIAAFEVKTK